MSESDDRRQPATIEFTYRNVRGGCAHVRFASDSASVELIPTDLTDALHDLVRATRDMLVRGRGTCLWANEPGTHECFFLRDAGTVHVLVRELTSDSLFWTPYEWAEEEVENEPGTRLFEADGDAIAFARSVEREANGVLAALGAVGYEEDWGRPFPTLALAELHAAIERGIP